MSQHDPLSELHLAEIESLATQATPGPWEAQLVLDFQTGEATRAVTHSPAGADDTVCVVEREAELSPANQRYIAALHPDATLRMVTEVRRLRTMEAQFDAVHSVLHHLNSFLELRGLTRQARRFVEVRSQMERLKPEADLPAAPQPRERGIARA
ncbi:MAG TPA: hypothetical protein VE913_24210 [Longimicrobium sp.]|nr:hypothetical protein [Longimicrobium sp.]